MARWIHNYSLYFAWLIAITATAVSLYLSVVRGMPVCDLCWYQRVCIYPLSILLGIAAYREDTSIAIYALPLTLVGFLFALYQYLEQMIPGFSPIGICGPGPNCSEIHMQWLGFITLPFLGMLTTVAIAVLLFLSYFYHRHQETGQ